MKQSKDSLYHHITGLIIACIGATVIICIGATVTIITGNNTTAMFGLIICIMLWLIGIEYDLYSKDKELKDLDVP